MTQTEFEQRVKKSVTAEEYAEIEKIYMSCPLDKDEFCMSWKNKKDLIVDSLYDELESKDNKIKKLNDEIFNLNFEKSQIVGTLVDLAYETGSYNVRDYAVSLSSRKDYLVAKLNKKFTLWSDEIDWVKEILENIN